LRLWRNFIHETDLSSTGGFSLLLGGCGKHFIQKPIYHLRELVFLFLWAVEN
jgi:hypothetical protein